MTGVQTCALPICFPVTIRWLWHSVDVCIICVCVVVFVVVFDVGDDARVEGLIILVGGGECCVSCGFRIVDVVVVCPESAGGVPVAYGLHSGSYVELFECVPADPVGFVDV